MSKLVIIVQCDKVTHKCSGFACTKSFYERSGKFDAYAPEDRYLSMSCGGCCGADMAAKIEHLNHKLDKAAGFASREDVVFHLASCIVSDNYHRGPCPFQNYLKSIIERKGYPVVKGSYISQRAAAKRAQGIYKEF